MDQQNHPFRDEEEGLPDDCPASEAIAVETLARDLRRIVMEEIKALPDVWQKLSESKQSAVIDRVCEKTDAAAQHAIIAARAGNHDAVPGLVEQVVFKEGIKAVIKLPPKVDGRHELADREGRQVMLVMIDADEYGFGEPRPSPDPDQPELLGDDAEYDDSDKRLDEIATGTE